MQSQGNQSNRSDHKRAVSRARHTHASARSQSSKRSPATAAARKTRAASARKDAGARRGADARHASAARKAAASRKQAPAVSEAPAKSKSPLLSRRAFVYGAVGVGAVAAVGVGAVALRNRGNDSSDSIDTLSVPQDAVVTQNDFEALDDYALQVKLRGSFDIPYGTLIWANDPDIAACLVPTESGSPLAKIAILHLSTGLLQNIREEAVGKAEGFEMLDVRANSSGAVWTESNIMEGSWRVYSARLAGSALEAPALLEDRKSVV